MLIVRKEIFSRAISWMPACVNLSQLEHIIKVRQSEQKYPVFTYTFVSFVGHERSFDLDFGPFLRTEHKWKHTFKKDAASVEKTQWQIAYNVVCAWLSDIVLHQGTIRYQTCCQDEYISSCSSLGADSAERRNEWWVWWVLWTRHGLDAPLMNLMFGGDAG